ncbi:E3 ubiquitin-protein ligase RING1-like [Ananas comosus]|uniref:E3 ubiquitin-protein ligase RING1-like n=1 Tax=Ananas comosus TaxID=4615 RepID=A0A6P5HAV9_ANACO|nr:E3 ubiquitin-protein ligase RING1-like [Ananas comosus]XP_020113625.1 E3 ubiquitin-protein ligase RING1-like [Ananas comosus]XP_020113626.1 E3 ubiquitin-protein ligase RING1-like [Ananas comosus]
MVIISSKLRLDQPWIVLEISFKGIEKPELGKVYYHYDSTRITTTIAKDVSCFIKNLDGSMTEIFQKLDVAIPFLGRLPPDSLGRLCIERHLRDKVHKAVKSCGSGGFMLGFEITVVLDSDPNRLYNITNIRPELATVATDADPLYSPMDRQPRLTTVLPTDADSSCCPICLDKLFGEELAVEWLPCAHSFHHGCIDSWFERAWTCPICRLSVE